MYKICIVGLGPAGICALANLSDELYESTIVFEPSAIGGVLSTDYADVVANITKADIVSALHSVPRWSNLSFSLLDAYKEHECPPLSQVMKQFRVLVYPLLQKISFHTKTIIKTIHCDSYWKLYTSDNNMYESKTILACTGAQPKTLDLSLPHIPLNVALCPSLLCKFVDPTMNIVLFGTSHSGTLILKNLKDIGCKKVTAIYKSEHPFYYARDGYSEGIKQESALIADEITKGIWGEFTPTLANYNDVSVVFRNLQNATIVIYAIGFEKGLFKYESASGECKEAVYTPNTNEFFTCSEKLQGIWGFGIGFPSLYTSTNGKQYSDIGFAGFIHAIKNALPSIHSFVS